MYKCIYFLILFFLFACNNRQKIEEHANRKPIPEIKANTLVLLGTIQDAGSPHIACKQNCCANLFENPDPNRKVISLGLIDFDNQKKYLFEATPDMVSQTKALHKMLPNEGRELPDGIFITHAHIGHYTGLMYLGKEATDAKQVPVYTMPKLASYLTNNGPWSQLVANKNVILDTIENEKMISLSETYRIIPLIVPHRDEYSETVGYKIIGPEKTALFIPDIDKWEKWDKSIIEEIKKVDYAFLDATFYSGKELGNRDISFIPHPFIIESLDKFQNLSPSEKSKIIFIHFNHTNPVLNLESEEAKLVIQKGFKIGQLYDVFNM